MKQTLAAERRRAARLARRLLCLEDEDPRGLRRRVLETLLQVVEADGASYYSLGVSQGRRYATKSEAVGSDDVGRCAAHIEGPQGCIAVRDTGLRDYARPSRLERTAFVEDGALWAAEVFLESVPYEKVLAPFGLRHQQRLLAFHGSLFLGWVGLLRSRGTPPFDLQDRQRLAPLVQPTITALLTAERLETAAQPEEAGDVVMSAAGQVLHASQPGLAWLDSPGFSERVASAVRELDRGRREPRAWAALGSALARVVRLDGVGGVRYLVHTEPLESLAMRPDTPLSARQRQVARSLAAGATVRETAEALGVSVETVRSHLRAVYDRLEVENRVELAAALSRPDDPSGPDGPPEDSVHRVS